MNEDETQMRYNLHCEISILKQSIHSHSCKLLTTLEETVLSLDEEIFPTIAQLLLIHYSLPVSVASAEWSFSSLKWLKTYLSPHQSTELSSWIIAS
jgi:hypothetical protein